MATTAGTLETLALELGKALVPLSDLLTQDPFETLGITIPSAVGGDANVVAKLNEAGTISGTLTPLLNNLASAITADNTPAILAAGAPLIAGIGQVIAKLKEAGDALHQSAESLAGAEKAKVQEFAAKFAARMVEYVSVQQLNDRMPTLTNSLTVLGLIDQPPNISTAIEAHEEPPIPFEPTRLYINRIVDLFTKPAEYLRETFGWGADDFTGLKLLTKIRQLLESMGIPAAIYEDVGKPPVLEAYVFTITPDISVLPPQLKIELTLPGSTNFNQQVDFSTLWKGTVAVKATYDAGLMVTMKPPMDIVVAPPSGNVSLDVLLGVKAEKTAADPVVLLGATGGSGLMAKSISASFGIKTELGTGGGKVSPAFQFAITEGRLLVDFSKGDGFIQQILSGIKLDAAFDLAASWDPAKGLMFQGNGGIEVFIPLHLDLVIVKVNGIYFSIGISTQYPLVLGVAAQLTTNLGPMTAVIDRIGTNINISFPEDGNGQLGIADLNFGFLPPKGVGLSMDSGVIKGGGFLSLDFERGEYTGALELTFQGFISLKAIGIINTKMPDGSNGFALLILITAEFTPIQLSFGFTLNGVGGLLALNRTVDNDAVKTGVRTGAINSVLFPQDIVANIQRIISDLKTLFPIEQGHFVLAPMAKLGWGTPPLITLELGIILDIPKPQFIILGVLRCILPTEEAALLKLQVNFAGGVDFDKGLIWFDASLFDSRLLIYTLTGDMALRIGWKTPLFVLSVGGFHPAFKEVPDDLRGMRRIGISLMSGDNPRIAAMSYFAVTSNTVQSGSRVELYAEAAGFNVYGFLGYDLLIQFNPFFFLADISAGLALRSGSSEIMGIGVNLQLSGPTPWHAEGEGHINMLFFEISVGFNITWGEDPPDPPLELEDVLKLLSDAVKDDRNWKADFPANTNQAVTIKKIQLATDKIIIHPFGILSVSQKVVPLGLSIAKFGNKKPKDETQFNLTTSVTAPTEEVVEEFAMAHFLQLSDSEKLSRASFEKKKSGLRFSVADASAYGTNMQKEVLYELSYVHKKKRFTFKVGLFRLFADISNVLQKANSIYKHAYSVNKKQAVIAPSKIVVQSQQYTVVNVKDMAPYEAGVYASTASEAYMMQEKLIKNNPSLKGKIQVVSEYELN